MTSSDLQVSYMQDTVHIINKTYMCVYVLYVYIIHIYIHTHIKSSVHTFNLSTQVAEAGGYL